MRALMWRQRRCRRRGDGSGASGRREAQQWRGEEEEIYEEYAQVPEGAAPAKRAKTGAGQGAGRKRQRDHDCGLGAGLENDPGRRRGARGESEADRGEVQEAEGERGGRLRRR